MHFRIPRGEFLEQMRSPRWGTSPTPRWGDRQPATAAPGPGLQSGHSRSALEHKIATSVRARVIAPLEDELSFPRGWQACFIGLGGRAGRAGHRRSNKIAPAELQQEFPPESARVPSKASSQNKPSHRVLSRVFAGARRDNGRVPQSSRRAEDNRADSDRAVLARGNPQRPGARGITAGGTLLSKRPETACWSPSRPQWSSTWRSGRRNHCILRGLHRTVAGARCQPPARRHVEQYPQSLDRGIPGPVMEGTASTHGRFGYTSDIGN